MDDSMDYVYHYPERQPNQGQLPYSQRPRCPYFNRAEAYGHTGIAPHRPYDPVHASASHWQSQSSLPPQHWQPPMLRHATSSPYHQAASSVPDHPYYAPMPSLRYQGPPHDIGGIQALHPSFPTPQLPPVQYGTNSSSRSQPAMAPAETSFGQPTASQNNNQFGTFTPPVTSSPPAPAQDSPSGESLSATDAPTPEFTAASTQAPLPNTNIQFGSAPPPSASQQHNNDGSFPYRPYRSAAGGEGLAVTSNIAPFPSFAHAISGGFSGSAGSSASMNSQAPTAPSAERRRVEATPLRRLSRRPSPPSDPYDHEGEFRMLEHIMGSVGRDIDDNHIRNAQLMRGSVTTKMVASVSAIQSLQSVDISNLSGSERSCIICYNDFGVETPEGVKEAPLQLPKCKHIFGDHCIKKWFEDSDSCPYCRDKVPSEPKMTSTNTNLTRLMYHQRATREREHREANSSADEGNRPLSSDRRSPPTDGGESRRRMRPRHGSVRGPSSPPFSVNRAGSYGTSLMSHERRPHGLMASRTHAPSMPSRVHGGGPSSVPFSSGQLTQYHIPSFGGSAGNASTQPTLGMASYMPAVPLSAPQSGQGSGFTNSANRNSLPAPPPGNWRTGDNSSIPLASGTTHWGGH